METVQTKPQGEGRSVEAISQLAWSLHYAVSNTQLHILAVSIGNTFIFLKFKPSYYVTDEIYFMDY